MAETPAPAPAVAEAADGEHVDVDLMVVYSENYATTQRVRLPRELDALGPQNPLVQQALLATVAPQVGHDIGLALRPDDVQAVRWTPACAAGTSVSAYAAGGRGKMHLLVVNSKSGAVARLKMMADAVTGMSAELRKKDDEIERLKQKVAELEHLRDHFAALLSSPQQQQQQKQEEQKQEEKKQ